MSFSQERERVGDSMLLDHSADLSVFEPDQHLAGRLSLGGDEGEQECRIRAQNLTKDFFSDFSSVASSQQLSKSPQVTPPGPLLPQSVLLDDLNLSESSTDEENQKVKVKNVTTSSLQEDQLKASEMNDVSRLDAKMKSRKVLKNLKPVAYLPPSSSSSSSSSDSDEEEKGEEEVEKQSKAEKEEALKMGRKAGLNRGTIKQTLEAYCNFRTPINFQLVDKWRGNNGQWRVLLSDGLWKHEFVMSGKFEYPMTKIKINSILCLNQIYKMKPKKDVPKEKMKVLLITNFFVPTMQQVDYKLIGCPKRLKL